MLWFVQTAQFAPLTFRKCLFSFKNKKIISWNFDQKAILNTQKCLQKLKLRSYRASKLKFN